jgi:hypothetical protein
MVSPGVYTYLVGDLPAGETGQITLGLHIDNSIPNDYLAITNTVEIGSAGAAEIPEATEQPQSNNISSDVDVIRGPDLAQVALKMETAHRAMHRHGRTCEEHGEYSITSKVPN